MVNPPSAYKTAINRLEAEKRSSHSEPQAARSEETSTPSESGDYPFSSLEQALKDAVPGASVTERESVRTGRPGKPPIYAFMIEVDGKRIMVDVEDYWSDSVVQLREKKTLTTLTKGTDADAVVVLVPTDGLDRYEKALGQISGTEVLDIDDVKAGRFGDLREFVDNEVLKDPKTQ